MFKYIRKDIEKILIPCEAPKDRSNDFNRFNPRYWQITDGKNFWYERINLPNYLYWSDQIEKNFFVFLFTGEKFPMINKHKEILPILKKYKFAKVYVAIPSLDSKDRILCYYFKRGVLFDHKYDVKDDKKTTSIKRLIKLLKLNDTKL